MCCQWKNSKGKNIGDTDILLQISEELNLNKDDIKESFLNDIDRKEVEAEEWSFRDLGIAGVPTYIINKEIKSELAIVNISLVAISITDFNKTKIIPVEPLLELSYINLCLIKF